MMYVQDVINYIKQFISFTFYGNDFPRGDNGNCGFVRIDGGTSPDLYIDGIKSPSIQIVIRHNKAGDAEQISKNIWRLFNNKTHYQIGNAKIKLSICYQSEPVYIGVDEQGRTIYSINVSCKIIE